MTTNGDSVSVQRVTTAVPGMPRYEVTDPDGSKHQFATYAEARVHKHTSGGTMVAV